MSNAGSHPGRAGGSPKSIRGSPWFTKALNEVKKKMKISGAQITAARNLLRITQAELAKACGVAERTIKSFEADHSVPLRSTLDKIQSELERRGIEFTNGDSPPSKSHGMGVRINFDKAAA